MHRTRQYSSTLLGGGLHQASNAFVCSMRMGQILSFPSRLEVRNPFQRNDVLGGVWRAAAAVEVRLLLAVASCCLTLQLLLLRPQVLLCEVAAAWAAAVEVRLLLEELLSRTRAFLSQISCLCEVRLLLEVVEVRLLLLLLMLLRRQDCRERSGAAAVEVRLLLEVLEVRLLLLLMLHL